MKVIEENGFRKLIADEGKKIRSINDVYGIDEEGEHYPYYTTEIYLAKNLDISKIEELYVEEEVSDEKISRTN